MDITVKSVKRAMTLKSNKYWERTSARYLALNQHLPNLSTWPSSVCAWAFPFPPKCLQFVHWQLSCLYIMSMHIAFRACGQLYFHSLPRTYFPITAVIGIVLLLFAFCWLLQCYTTCSTLLLYSFIGYSPITAVIGIVLLLFAFCWLLQCYTTCSTLWLT